MADREQTCLHIENSGSPGRPGVLRFAPADRRWAGRSGSVGLAAESAARTARRAALTETGLVFTTRFGTPIEPRNFTRSFDRRIGKAQVRRITVHGTRKSCGSLLAALDVHPRVAMQILRHSKIAITMEIYTEVVSSATREALRKLGDQLGP